MSDFSALDSIVASYEDQLEALMCLQHQRARIDPRSRFFSLADADLKDRLRQDRNELDLWALLTLVAAFEATLRRDMEERIQRRRHDAVRRLLQQLRDEQDGRVRFDDVLETWEDCVSVRPSLRGEIKRILKHRHWLAHGRYWSIKQGATPGPLDAHADLVDYLSALQKGIHDFPMQ